MIYTVSIHTRSLARPLPLLPEGDGPEAYLDIETTGLSPDSAQVTLVGFVYGEGGIRHLEQHFVEDPQSEAEVLRDVARRLRAFAVTQPPQAKTAAGLGGDTP